MLQPYCPRIFDKLASFSDAKVFLPRLSINLSEIGKVICKHNLQNLVGISLLHKHFAISPSECLVEELRGNEFFIQPQSNQDISVVSPYAWKLEDTTTGMSWYPLEFSVALDEPSFTTVINNNEFLTAIGYKLSQLEVTDVLGIAILHRNEIKQDVDKVLVETTNSSARTLTLSSVYKDSVDINETVPTLWKFSSIGDFESSGMCITHCISHCKAHH